MQVGGIKEYLSVSTSPKVAAQFVESFCFEPGADASLDLVFRPQVGFPGQTGHINVVVEQVRYRSWSWPLTAIRRLAGCSVRGELLPGRTTAQQLTHVVGGALTS